MHKHTIAALVAAASLIVAGCDRGTPESHIAAGKAHAAKGEMNAAVIEYKNALQKSPQNGEARFLLGVALLEQGNPLGAEAELRRALDAKRPADEVAPVLARALLDAGEQKKVVSEFGSTRLSGPEADANLRTTVGLALLQSNNPQAAAAAFADALKVKPDHVGARVGEARMLASRGDIAGANAAIDAVLAASAQDRDALQFKGDLAIAQGNFAVAADMFGKVVAVAPRTAPAWFSYIIALTEQNKSEEATKQLANFKKAVPNDARANYLQAWMDLRAGRKDAAKDAIAQVLRVAPDNVPTLALAGMIDAETGNYVQAEQHLLKVLERAPGHSMAAQTLATVYLRNRQPQKALERIEQLLRQQSRNPQILGLAAEIYLANGRVAESRRMFEQAAALNTQDPRAQLRLGEIYFASREDDKAAQALAAASALDPSSDRPDLVTISAALSRREFDKALAAIDSLAKKRPNSPIVDNLRGVAYLGKGDRARAREHYEKALNSDPTFFTAAMNLAQLDMRDGKRDQARQRFERVVEKDPKNSRAAAMLADFMIAEGRPAKEVVAVLERSVKGNSGSPEAHAALVAYHIRSNDARQAVTAAQGGVAALPDNPQMLELLGAAQQAAGEANQAITTFGKLQKLAPNSAGPLMRLAGAHLANKEYGTAVRQLERALELEPNNMEAVRQLAAAHVQAGSIDSAVKQAKLVQAKLAKAPTGYLLEGDIYATQKRWDDAERAYAAGQKVVPVPVFVVRRVQAADAAGATAKGDAVAADWIREQPKDLVIRTFLGERALRLKDYRASFNHYSTALAQQPENPLLLNNVAWTAGKIGDPKALDYAAKAVELAPEAPAVIDTYGTLLVERGQTERGLEMLQKAVQLAPAMAELRKNLGVALIKAGKKSEGKTELETALRLPDAAPVKGEIEAALKTL